MPKRNPHIAKLHAGYLFPEIHKRKHELQKRKPDAKIISLGIGDTTEPIPNHVLKGLIQGAERLGNREGYSGYGPEQGHEALRSKIAEVIYNKHISSDEVFISDGTKCDIGRLQMLFGSSAKMAVQDPSYPAYVDTGVSMGQTGAYHNNQYKGIVYMPCTPENHFFPTLKELPHADLIYFCSPNNPTGAVASHKQLKMLVDHAQKTKALIIFDAAYAAYIRDSKYPRSIYEIEGAHNCAIELNSFSKMVGFTGVRLGWSIVPKNLSYDNGESIHSDWQRMACTFFNGASNISQAGGLAALDPEGLSEIHAQTDFYLENAKLIKETFEEMGYKTYGGENAPYVWVHFPGRTSWEVFNELLEKMHLLATPGIGFGPGGESFMRFSAFGHREKICEALNRLKADLCHYGS